MMAMKLIRWAVMGLSVLMALRSSFATTSPWEQPASVLAEQIAGILGPGQAHLTIRNLSGISNDSVPAIRKLLEQDLKAHGVGVAEDESANSIRVTLSENARARLWVAEVVEGNVTQVAMVQLSSDEEQHAKTASGLTLAQGDRFSDQTNRCWRRWRPRTVWLCWSRSRSCSKHTVPMDGTSRAASALGKNVRCRAIQGEFYCRKAALRLKRGWRGRSVQARMSHRQRRDNGRRAASRATILGP